ncbi:MAG: MerR family transcriptional regulator [Bacteroidia bacterium]
MTSKYSIKDLERLSGIKAHTIRIWEQRYNLLNPDRTGTNIRLYNDDELKYVLNIASLIRAGGKISHIVKLNKQEITKRIQELVESPVKVDSFFETQTDNLVIAMLELDELMFEKAINTSSLKYGFEETMLNVIIPFLQKVGIMWRTGDASIIQEHFISNLIRKKVLVAIDGYIGNVAPDAEHWLLYLPEGELHEVGLLFSKYLLKVRGKKVMYFGQTVPVNDIMAYCKSYNPKYILTFFTAAYSKDGIVSYLNKLAEEIKNTEILVAGGQVCGWKPEWPNVRFLSVITDLIEIAGPVYPQKSIRIA